MCDDEWIVLLFLLQCGAFIWLLVKFSKLQSAFEQLRREIKTPVNPEIKKTSEPAPAAPSKVQPQPVPPARPMPRPSVQQIGRAHV